MSIPTPFDPIGSIDWIPKGYELIESVFFNGKTYIDTGFKQTQGDTYHVEITPFVNTGLGGWGGNGEGANSMVFFCIRANGTYYFGLNRAFGVGGTLISERTTIEFNSRGAFMNNKKIYDGTFTTVDCNWYLSTIHYYGHPIAKSRFFYGFIQRNGRLVGEYFPLKRLSDNSFHVYDRVTKSFPKVNGDPLQQ